MIQNVFTELERMGATGFAYASFRLEEDASFLHLMVEETSKAHYLSRMCLFREFQAGISDRCEEQPVIVTATTIGAHGMLPDHFGAVRDLLDESNKE